MSAEEPRPFEELSTSGLLWFLNHDLLHPRGYALGLHATEDGTYDGWRLLGDGTEAWSFAAEIDPIEYRAKVDELMPSSLDPADPLLARVNELDALFDQLMEFMIGLAEVAGEQAPSSLVDGVEDLVDAVITTMLAEGGEDDG